MKGALLFDIFAEKGGAENVAIMLAKRLKLDVYTAYVDWNNTDEQLKKLNINEIGLFLKNAKIFTYSEIAWRFSQLKLKDYDYFLFSRIYCVSGSSNNKPNIWISTGIVRSIYDLHGYFYKKMNIIQKPVFKIWCNIYRRFDQKWVKGFDSILCNSKFTADRIRKYYGIKPKVAYHPVDTKKFYCRDYEDFYLTASRLVSEKRLDLVIEAFKRMPEKQLTIAGDGPERAYLEKLARGCSNITFLGAINFPDIIELYSKCTATLSMCVSEDLGLIPMESMAAGKPCIASNAGGHKETIINGKTGYLIKPTLEEIIKHVKMLTPEKAKSMKKLCQERAQQFDVDIFIRKVKEEIKNVTEKN